MPPEETGLEALDRLRREFWEWADKVMALTPRFFQQLEADDDWAFLIKWHAVLETCANHLLTTYFAHPELASVFAFAAMSESKAGKVAFIEKCNLLPADHLKFIRKFSEMRNHAVHDIKNFGFTFREYVERYKKEDRNALLRQISFAYEDDLKGKDRRATAVSVARIIPRAAISVSCRMIVAEVFAWEKNKGDTDELARTRHLLTPLLALETPLMPGAPSSTTPPYDHSPKDHPH